MQLKPITAIIVLLLLVASLSVAGCTQTTTQTTSSPTASQKSVVTATPTPRETVSAAMVTVPQQVSTQFTTYAPNASHKFVGFNVTINNIAAQISNSNPYNWQLRDTSGNIYEPSIATYAITNGLKNVNTQPGDKVSGIIVFEVPQDATLKSLTYNGIGRTIITV